MLDAQIANLVRRKTISGRSITSEHDIGQSWIRSALSLVHTHLLGISHDPEASSEQQDASWFETMATAVTVAQTLAANLGNPVHYGDNKPGLWDRRGRLLTPGARFTYSDLLDYGMTGEDGFAGFLRDCGLAPDVSKQSVLRAAGLLLVDQAVVELSKGEESYAAYLMYQASSLAESVTLIAWEQMNPTKVKQAIRERLAERGRAAGKKSGAARQKASLAPPHKVKEEAAKLLRLGTEERNIAAVLARKFGVTPTTIRTARKKAN